jgi:hypothetical protein
MSSNVMGKNYVRPEIRKFFKEYPFVEKYFAKEQVRNAEAHVATDPLFFSGAAYGLYESLALDKEGNYLETIKGPEKLIPYSGNSKLRKFIILLTPQLPQKYRYGTLNDAFIRLEGKANLVHMVLGRSCVYGGENDIYLFTASNGISFKEWGEKLLAESEKS